MRSGSCPLSTLRLRRSYSSSDPSVDGLSSNSLSLSLSRCIVLDLCKSTKSYLCTLFVRYGNSCLYRSGANELSGGLGLPGVLVAGECPDKDGCTASCGDRGWGWRGRAG